MAEATGKYHKIISSEHKWYDLKLQEVWKYRDLIVLFTKRSFTVSYKQTILGPAWLFLNPLITSVIYTLVFGGIAGMSTDGVPQILFYMSGNAIWSFFASCVNTNANTFVSNANVFGKVYFPRLTVPISNILSAIIRFGIQMSMLLVFLIFYMIRGEAMPLWSCLIMIPVTLVQLGIMGMGVGIIISSMTTKYRDLSILVGFGVQLWMYATPVIYPISSMTGRWMPIILAINPVSAPVELFRRVFLGSGEFMVGSYIWSWIFTAIVAVFGIMVFNKVERTFMDTV